MRLYCKNCKKTVEVEHSRGKIYCTICEENLTSTAKSASKNKKQTKNKYEMYYDKEY